MCIQGFFILYFTLSKINQITCVTNKTLAGVVTVSAAVLVPSNPLCQAELFPLCS